ncbi:hypothetical protein Tco_1249800, partial [Tanacetum coccineum]
VLSQLSELETTLDVGIRHRNVVLHLVGFHLTLWMNIVRYRRHFNMQHMIATHKIDVEIGHSGKTIHLEVEISNNNNCVKGARYMIRMVFRYTSSVRPFMEICSKGYSTLGNQGIIL